MLLKEIFESAVNNVVLKFWSQSEKEALLKIVYEIYRSDQEFAPEEEKDFNEQLTQTKEALLQNKPVFEAAISDGILYSRPDILNPNEDGSWDIIEVSLRPDKAAENS